MMVGPGIALGLIIAGAMDKAEGQKPAQPPAAVDPVDPGPKAAAPHTEPVAEAPQPVGPPVVVTPEQLRKDYEANEVSSDERYRGKVLLVTGLVSAVRKDFSDHPYVEMSTNNQFMSVHARFAAGSVPELGSFSRGDKIVVRCVGNNVAVGSPQLKDCVLQHHYRWVKPASE